MTPPKVLLEARRFRVVAREFVTADGRAHRREYVEHPGSVTILPLVDPEHVCLVRNVRPAVGQTLVELPAGTLEPGEDPLETARRELAEETGYTARQLELLTSFYMSPGILNERMHLYVARGLSPGPQQLDEGEEIQRLVVSWSEARRMIAEGMIQDGKTLVGLLWYERIGGAP